MRALSVWPVWASKIAGGAKTIEVRSWRTSHRGPLLICATARPVVAGLPAGCAVCVVDLLDVRPFVVPTLDEPGDDLAACCEEAWEDRPDESQFAWVLAAPRAVERIPVKGRLGLYSVADELIRFVG